MKKLATKIIALLVVCTISLTFTLSATATDILRLQQEENIQISTLFEQMLSYTPSFTAEELCSAINSETRTSLTNLDSSLECGTFTNMLLDNYVAQATQEGKRVPDYLTQAKEKLNANSSTPSRTNTTDYVISSSEKFIVYYDQVDENDEDREFAAYLAAWMFDDVNSYLCESFGFPEPTTDGTYYRIDLIPDLDSWGLTHIYPNTPSIELKYDTVKNFLYSENAAFVMGVVAHEYMHAILDVYRIPYNNIEYKWFHESLARATGIIYETSYANNASVCADIRSFMNSIDETVTSFTAESQRGIRYGSCLFYLYLHEHYNQWTTLKYLIQELQYNSDGVMSAIENMLDDRYDETLSFSFRGFMTKNCDPDTNYQSSPKNRSITNYNTWGKPDYKCNTIISNTGMYISGTNTVPPLAAHYLRFTSTSNSPIALKFDLEYSLQYNSMNIPGIFYCYYNVPNSTLYASGYVLNNPITINRSMGASAINEFYIAIINTNTSGTIQYSYIADT